MMHWPIRNGFQIFANETQFAQEKLTWVTQFQPIISTVCEMF